MRIVITGSRKWVEYRPIQTLITDLHEMSRSCGEVLYVREGGAQGADRIARTVVYGIRNQGFDDIVSETFPADWDRFGKAAGMIRNKEMIAPPYIVDAVHAFPLVDSIGTYGMIRIAEAAGIPTFNHGSFMVGSRS